LRLRVARFSHLLDVDLVLHLPLPSSGARAHPGNLDAGQARLARSLGGSRPQGNNRHFNHLPTLLPTRPASSALPPQTIPSRKKHAPCVLVQSRLQPPSETAAHHYPKFPHVPTEACVKTARRSARVILVTFPPRGAVSRENRFEWRHTQQQQPVWPSPFPPRLLLAAALAATLYSAPFFLGMMRSATYEGAVICMSGSASKCFPGWKEQSNPVDEKMHPKPNSCCSPVASVAL
jgi:hypothetical protein